jgi:hypothetical protein
LVNLSEQILLKQLKADPTIGARIMQGKIKDPRFPEDSWQKMQFVHRPLNPVLKKITVHYFYNTKTGKVQQLKVK